MYLYHGSRETHAQQQHRPLHFTVNVAIQPLCWPKNKSTVLLQASLKTLRYHGEITTTFYFRSQNISLLKIILNAELITT